MNNPLVEQLYDLKKANYSDIRHLHTVKSMDRRLEQLARLILKIPKEKRVYTNKKYKRFMLERRLLGMKRALYEDKGDVMGLTRWMIQLSDRHTWEEKESIERRETAKKQHILPLLNLLLIKKSDDELRQLIAT